MIRGGDELSHTQQGNNNAYCQDNQLSWLNWSLSPQQSEFLDFCRKVVLLWQQHPVFQRRHFFQGRSIRGTEVRDITWLNPTGKEMTDANWHSELNRCLGVFLSGDLIDEVDEQGRQIVDSSMLLLMNSSPTDVTFTLPALPDHEFWWPLLDTMRPNAQPSRWPGEGSYLLTARSIAVLQLKQTWPQKIKDCISRLRGKSANHS